MIRANWRPPARGKEELLGSATRHLVAVWNPSYAADALDEHLRVLLDWSARARRGEAEAEDVYVWWARLRSPNRTTALPHLADVLAIRQQIEREIETHVYLTDFRSLYVGKVGDIEGHMLLADYPDEIEHLPEYAHHHPADVYFQLWDIRRLIADDTVAVVAELGELRNTRYSNRPVSLYGGMVDLPLIVERPDDRLWFGDEGILTDGRTWAEHDTQLRSETDRMQQELRENLFGDDVWSTLELGTRTFLASAEAVYRARRDDPAFDFSAPTVSYAKALETELNAIVFGSLRRLYAQGKPLGRLTQLNGQPIDLGREVAHQPLGTLAIALEKNDDIRRGLKALANASDYEYLVGELVHSLPRIRELRNPAAHSSRLGLDEASRVREEVLGIGREGVITKLARIKLRMRRA